MTIVRCPRCDGYGYVICEYEMAAMDCPLRCELGIHSLPLRARVALEDLEGRQLLGDFYNPDGVPDRDEVEAGILRGFWWPVLTDAA